VSCCHKDERQGDSQSHCRLDIGGACASGKRSSFILNSQGARKKRGRMCADVLKATRNVTVSRVPWMRRTEMVLLTNGKADRIEYMLKINYEL
jgi:hypothetical protein